MFILYLAICCMLIIVTFWYCLLLFITIYGVFTSCYYYAMVDSLVTMEMYLILSVDRGGVHVFCV